MNLREDFINEVEQAESPKEEGAATLGISEIKKEFEAFNIFFERKKFLTSAMTEAPTIS